MGRNLRKNAEDPLFASFYHEAVNVAFDRGRIEELVSGCPAEIGEVVERRGIGRKHFQSLSGRHFPQGLSGFEDRQRTAQACYV
jgi:hypothetical protein